MELNNTSPKKGKLNSFSEPNTERVNDDRNRTNLEIANMHTQLTTLSKNPDKNLELIKKIKAELSALQNKRDAKYTVPPVAPKKLGNVWDDVYTNGDPLKRGNNLR